MPPLLYYTLGATKKLNEIVMAGSHDAGITGGADNVQTQGKDIYHQAKCGVRIFDVRITAVGKKTAAHGLKTYHGSKIDPAKNSSRGAWGESLTKVLDEARRFVTNPKYQTEFLILKFDKSDPWPNIADQCVNDLGTDIYQGTGNLNTKTLDDLKGKVIVVFTPKGYKKVSNAHPLGSGILPIRKVPDDGGYDRNYDGMQYCGKGGTDWKKGGNVTAKVQENFTTQKERFGKGLGVGGHRDVLGMMYWTTTGAFGSILGRNDAMWNKNDAHRSRLKEMFKQGLADSITYRLTKDIDPTLYSSGATLKVYMPNFVMIDFADDEKCAKVFKLNTVAGTEITRAFQNYKNEMAHEEQRLNTLMTGGMAKYKA